MYSFFDTYILRTPLLSIDSFLDITKGKEITDQKLKDVFLKKAIQEAIYLASPSFFKELQKWSIAQDNKSNEKLKTSFLKYISRMSTRPTPFGMFSGCTVGNLSQKSKIYRDNAFNKRHTRLDMNLTGVIIKYIQDIPSIKEQLLYYPNDSLYKVGGLLRFIEYKYNDKSILTHKVIEVENSEYLELIIQGCKKGKNINEIAKSVIHFDEEISLEDAKDFVLELIDSQILINELTQTVCGEENLDNIIHVLERIEETDQVEVFKDIRNKLTQLDAQLENDVSTYKEIIKLLKTLNIPIEEKYVFQTDLIVGTKDNLLEHTTGQDVIEAFKLLNNIAYIQNLDEKNELDDFKKAFQERYESQEIPLSLVLDKEMGLGYPVNTGAGDVNPLIDDIVFGRNASSSLSQQKKWSDVDQLILNKTLKAIQNKEKTIVINEGEIPNEDKWTDLHDTLSTIAQLAIIDGEQYLYINFFSGSSAANLLGRFCHGDEKINDFVNKIIAKEEQINIDKVLAEIVHLPEDRLGNVLMRPSLRSHEISFLSRSNKHDEQKICLDDLLISIRYNRLFLRSKYSQKEICPKLTTAHNYKLSTLPAYKFLCDMQHLNKRNLVRFGWDSLNNMFEFFPRVIYKKILLSTAKWRIKTEEIKDIYEIENPDTILQKIRELQTRLDLPSLVYFIEGDNKLLINLENLSTVKMLLTLLKKKNSFILEEFIFSEDTLCKDVDNKRFVNEFIFSIYKDI
ncbi:lantibiotic dehydratase family protein [Bernardetia sp. OM2101]|uniref:lantibiotic dehydratase family protein n=1 Tax=Bernardetia sp. OM2101 TaxID=3344876 RepID=UPI0035D0C0AA